jgi:dicarboxylate/amino acid:cation (Na+ or H+) symporter, DAACS family
MKLWMKILIGLFLGVLAGLILGERAIYLKPIGNVFLNLINMIIVPLILGSMTVGITSIHDPKKLGRIGIKTLMLYLLTTLAAIFIGLTFAELFDVGYGLNLQIGSKVAASTSPASLTSIFLAIIPKNPFASMTEGNILQIIVFSVFLGISINFAGEKGKPLMRFMESLADVMYRMTAIIMEFAPIGVFAIMAWVTGTFGVALLIPLFKFLFIYYAACFVHIIIVFCGLLKGVSKVHPGPFFRGMGDAIVMAFSTGSSSATLPVSMHCTQENLGVSKRITNFVLPLGVTLNMNGTALFQAMSAIFVAEAYGVSLSWYSYVILSATAVLSAVGTAGVPGSGFIMLSAVLSAVGLPLEGLAILAGIDRLRDMVGTVLNVMGDAVVAVVIAKQEGEFDEAQYYHTELVKFED